MKESMIKDYIISLTGKEVDVEITENQPVLSKEGCWHLYLIPKPFVVGMIDQDDIELIVSLFKAAPAILDIYDRVKE